MWVSWLFLVRKLQNTETFLQLFNQKKSEKSWIFALVKFAISQLHFSYLPCRLIFVWAATHQYHIYFFNKEKFNRKRSFWFQKRQCILEFTLNVFLVLTPLILQSYIYILFKARLSYGYILFETNNTLGFTRQEWDEINRKFFFPI